MELTRRRDLMGTKVEPEEIYPVGTELTNKYIRGTANPFIEGRLSLSTGEFLTGETTYRASRAYVPISPRYTYQKNTSRIIVGCWYNGSYEFISSFQMNNQQVQNLPSAPKAAKFLRLEAINTVGAGSLRVTRIA